MNDTIERTVAHNSGYEGAEELIRAGRAVVYVSTSCANSLGTRLNLVAAEGVELPDDESFAGAGDPVAVTVSTAKFRGAKLDYIAKWWARKNYPGLPIVIKAHR